MPQTRWNSRVIKIILYFIAMLICLLMGWRLFFSVSRFSLLERPKSVVDIRPGANKRANSSSNDKWNFHRSARYRSDGVYLEACVVDAQTQEPVKLGKVAISEEPAQSEVFTESLDQNGCAGLSINPGRYRFVYEAPGYFQKHDLLELAFNQERIRKTIELSRFIVIKGVVKNAYFQPEPDATVVIGKLVDSTMAAFSMLVKSNVSGEFTIKPPWGKASIMVYASKPPFAIAGYGPYNIDELENKYLEIVLPKEEKIVTISGRIFDSQNRSIHNATVAFILFPSYRAGKPDRIPSTVSGLISQRLVKSDASGSFSFTILSGSTGIFSTDASGFEHYQEHINNVTKDILKDVRLKTPITFSVAVEDSDGQNIDETGFNLSGARKAEPGKYYATNYPLWVFAEGIKKNLGITERRRIETYQKEIVLKIGNCTLEGQVVDEMGAPINNISVDVNSIKEKGSQPEWYVNGSAQFSWAKGRFLLNNLVPGTASITISGWDSKNSFEQTTQAVVLEEGVTTKIMVVLKAK
jgi:hypothetical protein